jgi:hypothetical protein
VVGPAVANETRTTSIGQATMLRTIVDAMSDGPAEMDDQGRFVLRNPAADRHGPARAQPRRPGRPHDRGERNRAAAGQPRQPVHFAMDNHQAYETGLVFTPPTVLAYAPEYASA